MSLELHPLCTLFPRIEVWAWRKLKSGWSTRIVDLSKNCAIVVLRCGDAKRVGKAVFFGLVRPDRI